jgi:glycerophosphoryl diester phosphodiesterase
MLERAAFDRATFVRPVAHRGLHAVDRGIIENSAPAFEAAIAGRYAIECDVQPAADGSPVVFHDTALSRLVDAPGLTSDYTPAQLTRMTYRGDPSARILRLGDLLDLVAGRVPLFVEIKSEWAPPDMAFLRSVAAEASAYRGPLALMSFDPPVVAAIKDLAPGLPRGIVSGLYDASWWPGKLDAERAARLSHLLESRAAAPDFFAYHVKALPTPVTRFVREVLGMPLFTWTVRTAGELASARTWADAPIFEDVDPKV